MGTKVNIMDMEVDLLPKETFQAEIQKYLDNDYLDVVHMISLDYIDNYDTNELVRQTLKEAQLVLPGERAILSAHHVDVLETGGMVVDYRGVSDILQSLKEQNRTLYLVLRNAKEAKVVYRYITRHFEKEQIVGVYADDGEVTEEALINDINTKLPDIILLSMASTAQEEWLENNKAKLNAKLCVVVGSVMPLVMRENVHVPTWICKLHLDGAYRWLTKIPYSNTFRKRIFNRKMDNYNSKKKLKKFRRL